MPDRQIRQSLIAAARCHYAGLLDAGVAIHEYRPTMMHNKVMVVDRIWSTVGSIKFVNRSTGR